MSRTLLAAIVVLMGSGGPAAEAVGQKTLGSSSHISTVPEVSANVREGPITIDGRLAEGGWERALPATDFRQFEPNEGEQATQRTEVRFLFDAEAIYVGARMYDDHGAEGVTSRLTRRDAELQGGSESDFVSVVFDTYHDHLGSATFGVNPSGVKHDMLSGDSSWDPVWEGVAQMDSLGWTAELRIPLSQLRFAPSSAQTWGLQINRRVTRLNERSAWAFWRQNETGGPSRFGHLTDLEASTTPARMEILPYMVAQSTRRPANGGADPFYRQSEQAYRTGVDLKYLLSSNLTLSATINPDFGQVEVDPAVVNLSAFETFFQEKRPFFVEGQSFFDFGPFWCFFCSNVAGLDLFYTRRIGRVPQGTALADERSEYADSPDNTTILGAAKVTGRTRSGWSIGLLDAVGAEEQAELALDDGSRADMVVEPPTNYFVGRIKRDLLDGNLVLGGMATSTYRRLDSGALTSRLTGRAEAVGLDAELWWKERTYHFLASVAFSQVSGDTAAIRRVQESSARYFQRPGRELDSNGLFTDSYDADLTALRGYAFSARIAKDAGDWRWELGANGKSPGFEVNDIAFLQRTDFIWLNANVYRLWTRPTRYFRRLTLRFGAQEQFNFQGERTDLQARAFAQMQLPNYWSVGGFVIRVPAFFEDRLTRGGPTVRRHGHTVYTASVATDSRRALAFSVEPNLTAHPFGTDYSIGVNAIFRPASNVSVRLGPRYGYGVNGYQYVDVQDDPTATAFEGRRYIFADVTQRTVAIDTQLNVTISPTLSMDLFAQPFISSAAYENFKEFDAPRQLGMSTYGKDIGTITRRGTGDEREYVIDPDDGGPAAEFTVDDPDFNFRSLRGNAVLRWEYRPGSTLFLVWTQTRDDTAALGDLHFDRDWRSIFSADPHNVFLLKLNYWLSR
ncbi:MAG: hypothetical protein GEU90_13975 [Gemmatimonas sp.]|nr:hypothetical protein [Gemmatimonas sp.]